MDNNRIAQILFKPEASRSAEEQLLLEQWLQAAAQNRRLFDELQDEELLAEKLAMAHPAFRLGLRERILARIREKENIGSADAAEAPVIELKRRSSRTSWVAAVAILVVLLGGGIYFWLNRTEQADAPVVVNRPSQDVPPGKAGAILTLDDGRQVVLDSLANGKIATQGKTDVTLQDGQVLYATGKDLNLPAAVTYNTMTTPKGRQYQLVLPDGTKVWLNAASSIRYPTFFAGEERKVELSGEAYFEVAKNARMPFRVRIQDDTEVEVLGTHFNVNAYADEAGITTTLLEGKVLVKEKDATQLLAPGQAAVVNDKTGVIRFVREADTEQAVAWKNGVFSFDNADLPTVMRQLARWYDVDVVYEGKPPAGTFTGDIDRSLTLDQLLKGLAKTRIQYTIEGKRITILSESN